MHKVTLLPIDNAKQMLRFDCSSTDKSKQLDLINRKLFDILNTQGIYTYYMNEPGDTESEFYVENIHPLKLDFEVHLNLSHKYDHFKNSDIDQYDEPKDTTLKPRISSAAYSKQIRPGEYIQNLLILTKYYNGTKLQLLNDDLIEGYFIDTDTSRKIKLQAKRIFILLSEIFSNMGIVLNSANLNFGFNNGELVLIGDLTPTSKLQIKHMNNELTDDKLIQILYDNFTMLKLKCKTIKTANDLMSHVRRKNSITVDCEVGGLDKTDPNLKFFMQQTIPDNIKTQTLITNHNDLLYRIRHDINIMNV